MECELVAMFEAVRTADNAAIQAATEAALDVIKNVESIGPIISVAQQSEDVFIRNMAVVMIKRFVEYHSDGFPNKGGLLEAIIHMLIRETTDSIRGLLVELICILMDESMMPMIIEPIT